MKDRLSLEICMLGPCPQGPGLLVNSEAPCSPDRMLGVAELLDLYFSNAIKEFLVCNNFSQKPVFSLVCLPTGLLWSPLPPLLSQTGIINTPKELTAADPP